MLTVIVSYVIMLLDLNESIQAALAIFPFPIWLFISNFRGTYPTIYVGILDLLLMVCFGFHTNCSPANIKWKLIHLEISYICDILIFEYSLARLPSRDTVFLRFRKK